MNRIIFEHSALYHELVFSKFTCLTFTSLGNPQVYDNMCCTSHWKHICWDHAHNGKCLGRIYMSCINHCYQVHAPRLNWVDVQL